MAASTSKKDDPIERLRGVVNEILDEREQRSKEEKDPKARFDRVMGRLEAFLDGAEKKSATEKEPPEKKAGGGFLDILTGTGD